MLYAMFPLEGGNPQIPNGLEDHIAVKAIYTPYAPKAWFIDFEGTTNELTDLIWPDDFDEDTHPLPAGIVTRMDRYNGWASPDLWEWLGVHHHDR